MLTTILSLLSSSVLGTAFGFIGNLITQWNDREMMKIKNTHELAKMDKEADIMIKEADARIKVSVEETRKATEVANIDVYKEAVKQEGITLFKKEYMDYLMRPVTAWYYFHQWVRILCGTMIALLFALVDVMKMAVRPSVTYYWVVITTLLTFKLEQEVGGFASLDTKVKMELFRYILSFVFFECSTILMFWFCDRRNSKSRKALDI